MNEETYKLFVAHAFAALIQVRCEPNATRYDFDMIAAEAIEAANALSRRLADNRLDLLAIQAGCQSPNQPSKP